MSPADVKKLSLFFIIGTRALQCSTDPDVNPFTTICSLSCTLWIRKTKVWQCCPLERWGKLHFHCCFIIFFVRMCVLSVNVCMFEWPPQCTWWFRLRDSPLSGSEHISQQHSPNYVCRSQWRSRTKPSLFELAAVDTKVWAQVKKTEERVTITERETLLLLNLR